MDIVTFNVHTVNDEDTFPFFVPDVKPLGTQGLSQNRLIGAPEDIARTLPDELAPVPAPEVFSAQTGVELSHIDLRDKLFCEEVGKVVRTVFETTKSVVTASLQHGRRECARFLLAVALRLRCTERRSWVCAFPVQRVFS